MYKRANGLWTEKITINGAQKSFYGKTKAELLHKIAEYQETKERGRLFSEVADEWDSEHAESVSFNAHRCYRVPYKSVVSLFGSTPIKQIAPSDLNAYIKRVAAQGYALRTVKGYISVLKLIFEHAIIAGDININPADSIRPPRGLKTTKRTIPSEDTIKAIESHTNSKYSLLPLFILYTGCRRGEALAIKYEDIDFKNKTIRVEKSVYYDGNAPFIKSTKTEAGERTIPLLTKLEAVLPKGKGFVFGTEDKPPTLCTFKRHWEAFCNEADITVTPHQLRHLFATVLYESGIDEKLAQEILGHSSIRMTKDLYTHIRTSKLDEAREKINSFSL